MEEQPTRQGTPVSVPLVTRQRFAELAGVDEGVVRGWMERGQIPTYKVGRHRLINLAVLIQECLEQGHEYQ